MSYGVLGSTGFGATGGPAWYQVWSAGEGLGNWAGWLWADAAAAQRVANACAARAVIRTGSGQLVPRKKYKRPAYCYTDAAFITCDGSYSHGCRPADKGIEKLRPECLGYRAVIRTTSGQLVPSSATGGAAWYQVWNVGEGASLSHHSTQWAGWLWADAAAAQRVGRAC